MNKTTDEVDWAVKKRKRKKVHSYLLTAEVVHFRFHLDVNYDVDWVVKKKRFIVIYSQRKLSL